MRKIVLMMLVVVLMAFGQDSAMPENPWFDHIRRPTTATHEDLCALAKSLHAAFKSGTPSKKIATLAPADGSPRAVFITIGGNTWPGRTYFGVGMSFSAALETAAQYLISNEPEFAKETVKLAKSINEERAKQGRAPAKEWIERQAHPIEWNWLKLDVVQVAKPAYGFIMSKSRIALTSLVGFSFGPDMGYAFTPDQITGRCLITDAGYIAPMKVGNLISENYNWPALKIWMKLSGVNTGHRICLFETDSYYSDGNESCRLYRGHRLFSAPPDEEACRKMMQANVARLVAMVEPSGAIRPPMTAWISTTRDEKDAGAKAAAKKNRNPMVESQDDVLFDESFDVKAELAMVLAKIAHMTGDESLNNVALRALSPVIQSMKVYGKDSAAIIETEKLPEGSFLSPQKVSLLKTNALACLALMELKSNGMEVASGIDNSIRLLVSHIKKQFSTGCDFIAGRYWSTGKPMNDELHGSLAQVEDVSMAALALSKFAEIYSDDETLKFSDSIIDDLIEFKITILPIESLTLNPWMAEAITRRKREDKKYWVALLKLAGGITSMTDKAPLYPDYYGAVRRFPSCTAAAEHTWMLALISRKLRELDKPYLANEQLEEAMPILLFQSQAFIDVQSSCVMPSPAAYVSFFRDNLENYGFNLEGQLAQIQSLAEISTELKATKELKLKTILDDVVKARKESDIHPGPLTVELILTNEKDVDGMHRDLLGGVTQGKTIRKVLKAPSGGQKPASKTKKKNN